MSPSRLLLPLLVLLVSGCSELGYYAQATRGQMDILAAREDISELIADSDTPDALRQRLQLAQDIRSFAIDSLALPDSEAYTSYTATGRKYVVWNVLAAPAYDLSLKTWCFPVAGCVAYKGFFTREAAVELEQQLANEDYDTFLYGVSAYSTLGWFADPVLDTFIDYPDIALASLLIHEMAHQVVYVKDDSSFNEAFATAVEQAGVREWISANATDVEARQYLEKLERNNRITEMILAFREELATAYTTTADSELEQTKREMFAELSDRYAGIVADQGGTRYYDWWFSQDLNNAHLSAVSTYFRLVPAFTAALESAGSYSAFYELVAEKAELPREERDRWIEELLNKSG